MDTNTSTTTATKSRFERAQDVREDCIRRQHSQEMALRYFALNGKVPTTKQLREMISWFQRDIDKSPLPEQ